MQAEIDSLMEEEERLDFKKGYDKISKRVADKRRSHSTMGKIGRGLVSAADTVFGGPPPKTSKKGKPKKKKKKTKDKRDDDYFFVPFI